MNYKDSLLLPKTDFPMKADLIQREPERLAKWESAGLYWQIQEARKNEPLFVLHDGPPFANGDVHMGTALNKILKDMIVKSRTMAGLRAPFVPGWDCHGLPIEFKVVKETRGLVPAEVRRRAEEFARKFIDIQRRQFKRLGVLGDWENPYLTLAPGYEAEVLRAFAIFVEKGLVYQAKKPVSWSTGAQTALAEAEVEFASRTDPAIFVKFKITEESAQSSPVKTPASFVIWTTTPWTLPANVAIAVDPREHYWIADFRHKESGNIEKLIIADSPGILRRFEEATGFVLVESYRTPEDADVWEQSRKDAGLGSTREIFGDGRCVDGFHVPGCELVSLVAQHPFLPRTSKVITADFVTMETGTGQVHIAPGHGKDDYIAGQQQSPKLPVLSPVDDYGKFTEEVGMPQWVGKYVFDANAEIVAFLRENGSLLAEQKYTHEYPHCWRSKTPIVFRAVEQFFIRVDAIRADALAAIDQVNWLPPWGRNRIYGTVESRPDWCISRQRTWGVPLPVFYKKGTGEPILKVEWIRKIADLIERRGTNIWFELSEAQLLQEAGITTSDVEEVLSLPGPHVGVTHSILSKTNLDEMVELAAEDEEHKKRIKQGIEGAMEKLNRRNDTLDVWIDSGVSHTAVMKTRPELGGGPADIYLEATDQHRGWFQSSLMTSIAMTGAAPYKTVITHGFVVDKDGKKISKSSDYKKPMDAEHFVGKYGADIVRLWCASVDYQNEVPFSEEAFTRLGEAYRSFRNVLRILLANTSDRSDWSDQSDQGTLIDRWVLSRLQEIIGVCTEAYAAYDFRKVFQTLNQFVAVEISALYVDITKDRMYCDAANSPRRRATQTVMHAVFDALAKLLAPILVFTADEAWEFAGNTTSIHLEKLPEADAMLRDTALEAHVEELLKLRAVIAQAVEAATQSKLITKGLEAVVTLQLSDEDGNRDFFNTVKNKTAALEELFILSDLTITFGAETKATLVRTPHAKCARCWRHRASVTTIPAHPELCDRCASVVGG